MLTLCHFVDTTELSPRQFFANQDLFDMKKFAVSVTIWGIGGFKVVHSIETSLGDTEAVKNATEKALSISDHKNTRVSSIFWCEIN